MKSNASIYSGKGINPQTVFVRIRPCRRTISGVSQRQTRRRKMKNVMKVCLLVLLSLFAIQAILPAQEAPAAEATQTVAKPGKASDEKRVQIAKLRGKLLYKRSQIRKLEKEASTKDSALASKVNDLEQQRRLLFENAEPKLKTLYAEEAAFELEIENLNANN